MKRFRLLFATAGIILAGAAALDILGDQSVATESVRITSAAHGGEFRIDVPRTVSCPIDPAALEGN